MRTDDGYIIHQCLNGNPEAFGVLVDKYKEGIYAFTYAKLQNWQDAQDVTQETFIQAYRKLKTLRKWDSFAGWLYRIALNFCKNWQSSKLKRLDRDLIDDQNPALIDEISQDHYRENEMYESVRSALNSLPENYREVLTLYYFGGMDTNKIAEVLSASPLSIRIRLSRARAQLREEMFNMLGIAFEQHKLRSGFTFKVVEAIKRIKIQPISQTKALPWGLSLATGLIFVILSIGTQISPNITFDSLGGSFLPSESKVLKIGEIPVDITNVSKVTFLSSQQENGIGIDKWANQNAFFMAPQGEGKWVRKAGMNTPRVQFGTAVVNGKIYAIGGISDLNLNVTSSVEEYDPIKDNWVTKKNIPIPAMFNYSVNVVDGKIYVIGGSSGPFVQIYDPKTDEWELKENMPTSRMNFCTEVVNGRIYAISGIGAQNFEMTSVVEEYDPVNDKWTRKSDMPAPPRECFCSVVFNNRIYIFGGCNTPAGANWGTPIPEVLEYNPVTDIWTLKSNMPTPRIGAGAVLVDNKIYTIAGFNGVGTLYTTVEIYDPINDSWTKGVDVLNARSFPCCSAVNGKIYVLGGYDGAIMTNVEEYDTGFRPPQAIDLKGKIPSTWGDKKK